MFQWARAAGLPMLGGYDVFAHYRDACEIPFLGSRAASPGPL